MREILHVERQALRLPRLKLPSGAVDTHVHVFGPVGRYPYDEARGFTPEDAPPAMAAEFFRRAGIGRAVLVQPSVYGTDNDRHLDAGAELSLPTRIIVAIETDASEAHLAALDDRGARGVRRILPQQVTGETIADLQHLGRRISELGWHLQLLARPEHLVAFESELADLSCPVVFDHLALPDAAAAVSQPGFQALLRLLRDRRGYVKVSGLYRVSRQIAPYADLAPFVRAVVATASDRVVWGSDWPHPAFSGPVPACADLIDPLLDWIPDESARQQIFVTNPTELYGFEPIERA